MFSLIDLYALFFPLVIMFQYYRLLKVFQMQKQFSLTLRVTSLFLAASHRYFYLLIAYCGEIFFSLEKMAFETINRSSKDILCFMKPSLILYIVFGLIEFMYVVNKWLCLMLSVLSSSRLMLSSAYCLLVAMVL